MSEDFTWSNNPDVIVKQVDAIAVYANNNGDIVIRQNNSMGEEDSFIVVPPEHIPALIKALEQEARS